MHPLSSLITSRAEGSATFAALSTLRLITASGSDALSFLHSQLTQDVTALPADTARLSGYCSAKGRLLATLVMWRADSTTPDAPQWFALMRADATDAMLKRLSMFVLRAKVSFMQPDWAVAGVSACTAQRDALHAAAGGVLPDTLWARVELASGTWIAAPSSGPQQRWWWIAQPHQLNTHGAALAAQLSNVPEDVWRAADLAAGLPWIGAHTQDLFIPQTVNLELIDGVSFTKGCYPGQEVVARSHYRGTVKRRMAYGTTALPTPTVGEDVYNAQTPAEPCGRVIDSAQINDQVAALLFETTLAALPDNALRLGTSDGPEIQLSALPYSITPT